MAIPPLPDPEDLQEAMRSENTQVIADYAIQYHIIREAVERELPRLTEAAGTAKRDLDVAKAQKKHCDNTINMCQTLLKTLRPI